MGVSEILDKFQNSQCTWKFSVAFKSFSSFSDICSAFKKFSAWLTNSWCIKKKISVHFKDSRSSLQIIFAPCPQHISTITKIVWNNPITLYLFCNLLKLQKILYWRFSNNFWKNVMGMLGMCWSSNLNQLPLNQFYYFIPTYFVLSKKFSITHLHTLLSF